MLQPKCLECGGVVEFNEITFVGKCKYCGNTFIFERPLNNQNLIKYELATDKLRNNNFEEAQFLFCELAKVCPNIEIYWGALLAEFGVEIDFDNNIQNVIIYKTNSKTIFESENYKNLVMLGLSQERYDKVLEIERIKLQINSLSNLQDNQISICYEKSSNDAEKVSSFLTQNKYKVYVCHTENEAQNYCALQSAKTLLILQDKNSNLNKQKKYWQRFLTMHPYSQKNNVIVVGYNKLDLPQRLQSYSFINYKEFTSENLLNLLKNSTETQFEILKTNDNALFEKTENIEKALEELNQNIVKSLNNNFNSNTRNNIENSNFTKKIYDLIEQGEFKKAYEIFNNIDIPNLYDYHLIKLLIKYNQTSFENLIEYLKNIENILNDNDFINLVYNATFKTKKYLSTIFADFIDYIYLKEKEFAQNCCLDSDGNLIKFIFNNKQEDLIMCKGRHRA